MSEVKIACERLLHITSEQEFSFSVSHLYSQDYNAKHWSELPVRHETIVAVDAFQMGVGGDNSWEAMPHAQYLFRGGKYRACWTICFE